MVNQYTNPWTEEELQILKMNYNKTRSVQLAKLILKHNVYALRIKANKMGLRKNKDLRSETARLVANWKASVNLWDEKELAIVRKFYPTLQKEHLLKILPRRNWHGIMSKASKLGIKRLAHMGVHSAFMKKNNPMSVSAVRKKHLENTPRGNSHPSKKEGYIPPMKGKYHSVETKMKISKAKIGRKRDSETIKRMSMTRKRLFESGELIPPMKGKSHKSETKNRLSNIHKALWREKEYAEKMMKKIHAKPNNIESRLIDIVKRNNIPLRYVGDGSFMIRGLNPDFIETTEKKKVLELFGRVFHDPVKSFLKIPWKRQYFGRLAYYSQCGWDCLVLWDDELDDEEVVVRKIAKFLSVSSKEVEEVKQ